MSTEIHLKYNQWIKSVEFFPFEWSSNILAVCLKDSIKVYLYDEIDQDPVRRNYFHLLTKKR